uniref:Uncharacterized protein n=1 Tax=Spongospora subterranea TaxID=70186 RepID=A0A0H5R2S8_9EUKA|eukprot:CRZ08207.1 hypothetical protein [Spongospora subterranea]
MFPSIITGLYLICTSTTTAMFEKIRQLAIINYRYLLPRWHNDSRCRTSNRTACVCDFHDFASTGSLNFDDRNFGSGRVVLVQRDAWERMLPHLCTPNQGHSPFPDQ